MKTKIIEASQSSQGGNWGKFLIGRFDTEWDHPSHLPGSAEGRPLLQARMRNPQAMLVLDLETNEGAMFVPYGMATADLNKHQIWVCPLFEPFLNWLYDFFRDFSGDVDAAFDALPHYTELPGAEFLLAGHRRRGTEQQ
jgi:hypothetical protein